MTTKEPKDAVILAARIARAYPSLSAYSSATLAEQLCAIERMQRRHAERQCSGADGGYTKLRSQEERNRAFYEARAQGRPCATRECLVEHDPEAEERAGKRIANKAARWLHTLKDRGTFFEWTISNPDLLFKHRDHKADTWHRCTIELQHDPRGAVLLVRLPGETEASGV